MPVAPLFFRKLQKALRPGLEQSGQNYSGKLSLTSGEREELQWWLDHLSVWNRQDYRDGKTVDRGGIGRLNLRPGSDLRRGSHGRPMVRQWHINCLKVLAAFHAVKCFVRDKRGVSVLLRLDNTLSTVLREQARRHSLAETECYCERTVALGHCERHHPDCGAPTGRPEYDSGRGVPRDE